VFVLGAIEGWNVVGPDWLDDLSAHLLERLDERDKQLSPPTAPQMARGGIICARSLPNHCSPNTAKSRAFETSNSRSEAKMLQAEFNRSVARGSSTARQRSSRELETPRVPIVAR